MDDSLTILKAVNEFYAQSFSQLITITIAILAFAGVIMPLLILWYQRQIFKTDQKKIMELIKEDLQNELDIGIEKIESTIQEGDVERAARYENRIRDVEKNMETEVAKVFGGSFHIQANASLKDGNHIQAFSSLVVAAKYYIKSKDESNLTRVTRIMRDQCLPKLNKQVLDDYIDDVETDFEKFIENLQEINTGGRYTDEIKRLKHELKKAKQRSASEQPPNLQDQD